jgi:hypothetical protein
MARKIQFSGNFKSAQFKADGFMIPSSENNGDQCEKSFTNLHHSWPVELYFIILSQQKSIEIRIYNPKFENSIEV